MIFYGKIVNEWNGVIKGQALVSKKRISFLGDIDPKRGIVRDPNSDIRGEHLKGRILVFKGGRGSTVGASVIYALKKFGNAPLAIVTVESDPVVISGAIFSDIPMISEVSEKILDIIQSGTVLELIERRNKGLIKVV